ncbi:MAG: tyrosine-type recombinase/integrase [Chloroflexota bacterium]
MVGAPRIVAAEWPERGRMFYLVDDDLEFIPEVKAFLDWKVATRRAPATVEGYCYRLMWYYRFLHEHAVGLLDARPEDLTEFVLWLCTTPRSGVPAGSGVPDWPLQARSVNLILQAVGALYRFLVQRGLLAASPVEYVAVPRSTWLRERDLLAHTRRGPRTGTVLRLALKLKEPRRRPTTVTEQDFQTFLSSIHIARRPQDDPAGFRDRVLCLLLKEGGLRSGEALGLHLEDLDFGCGGVHVRFRPDNMNQARAKAGYGRDRFVHLAPDLLGLLDLYISEVWVRLSPCTTHLWVVTKQGARTREGRATVGTALTAAACAKMFEHYSRKSGVKIHAHMLRHTHATELVRSYLQAEQAVDWKYIQERLGHASVVTTMEIYTHLTNEDRKKSYDAYLARRAAAHARRHSGPAAGSACP